MCKVIAKTNKVVLCQGVLTPSFSVSLKLICKCGSILSSPYKNSAPNPKPTTADGQGLRNARPQTFTLASGGGGGIAVDLTLPAPFAYRTETNSMVPDNGSEINVKREAQINLGTVTVTT